MQPHSLGKITLDDGMTPAKRDAHLRHGRYPKGTVLPETQVPACPRVRVADLPEGHLKKSHIEHLEQNQMIASCCRHPENHEVEARKSHPSEQAPDIYLFHCKCGKTHPFFCVGQHDERPVWDAT